jgi:hypothetical protein
VRDRAQGDRHHPIRDRHQKHQPRALLGEAAEAERHAALVLAQHADRRAREHQRHHHQDHYDD